MEEMGVALAKNGKRRWSVEQKVGIVIEPDAGGVGTMDFSQKKKCMTTGIKAAQDKISKIKEIIAAWKKT